MLGNKKIVYLLLIIVILFSGCSNIQNNKINNISSENIDRKENYFTITTNEVDDYKKIEYEKVEIDTNFSNKKELLPPVNHDFTPIKLVDNKFLVGESREISRLNNRFLSIYDLNSQKLKNLLQLEQIKEDNVYIPVNLNILFSNEKYVLYATYYKGTTKYYIYDLYNEREKIILSKENMPEGLFDQGLVTDSYILLSILNIETNKYELKYYDLDTFEEKTITDKNSGFPVVIKNKIYYLELLNEEKKTQIVEYDTVENTKTIKYKTVDENEYIIFLSGSSNLVMGIRKNDETYVYLLEENNEAILKHKSSWIESPIFSGNKLSYLGDKREAERARMQYYLIDFENKKDINNTGGPIYISNDSIVWVHYKVKDLDIPKGAVFRREYTTLYYSHI